MKDLTWLREDLIAHRGLYQKDQSVPENSLLAFQLAIEKGYSIECDVNVLKDGTVVVFHDANFKRLCGDDRLLKDVLYSEIHDLKLAQSNQGIITLDELIQIVDGRVGLLIELKPHGDVDLLSARVDHIMNNYQGKWAVFSFHPKVVRWFKLNNPSVIRGQISEYFSHNRMPKISKYLLKSMVFNRFNKPDFISYSIKDLPNKYLDKAKKKGLTIISYAAQTQTQFDFVKSHYHNVVFEFFEPKI